MPYNKYSYSQKIIKKIDHFINCKFIFILATFLNIFPNISWANNSDQRVPEKVYRSTPSKPDKVFSQGFRRSRDEHVDLSRHINGESLDPSGFISTTSNRQYAYNYAIMYASGWWHVNEFFVYEIIPDSNFVSVSDTFLRTARNETDSSSRVNLESARSTFTREEEYSALYLIPPERVIAATRFEFDHNTRRFEERERIINTVTRTDESNPQLQPSIHPNTYSLGTYASRQFTYNGISSGFACTSLASTSSAPMKKKRSISDFNIKCPTINTKKIENLEPPSSFLEKSSFRIKTTAYGYTYCLTTYNNYVYLDYKCKNPQKWSYTEFGQLISEINDGQNQQYYCMTAPSDSSTEDYAKMQICDLNNGKQVWKIKKLANGDSLIFSSNNFSLAYYKKYAYLRKKHEGEDVLKINNAHFFIEKKVNALIQFSINHLQTKDKYILYPTTHGNAYVGNASSLENYTNFYNAHSNALFSSYGNKNIGPQVCYFSSLLRNGGSSWGWVKDEYCSTKEKMKNEFRWVFSKKGESNNTYSLYDIANNILRIDNITASNNRYFAYTAYKDWYDSDSFTDSFILSAVPKIYADAYSSTELFKPTQEQKLSYALSVIKEKYNSKIQKLLK